MPWYTPRSLRAQLAPYVVGAVLLALTALGGWLAVRAYGAQRYDAGRASLLAESAQWLAASNHEWRRVADSLTVETRHRDTVLVTRIARARATASLVYKTFDSTHVAPDVLTGDTQTVALRACGVQLDALADECSRFRVAATAALAAKDSAAARDSVRLRAAALDAASYKQQALEMWRKLEDDAAKRRGTRWLYVLAGAALTWGVMR